MRYHIARILRDFGNLLFDTAERIHPIDNQPMGVTRSLHGYHSWYITPAMPCDALRREYDQN